MKRPDEGLSDENAPDFGAWLTARLAERDWSQERAARALGVSLATVSRWCRGLAEPSYRELWTVHRTFLQGPFCDALGQTSKARGVDPGRTPNRTRTRTR